MLNVSQERSRGSRQTGQEAGLEGAYLMGLCRGLVKCVIASTLGGCSGSVWVLVIVSLILLICHVCMVKSHERPGHIVPTCSEWSQRWWGEKSKVKYNFSNRLSNCASV